MNSRFEAWAGAPLLAATSNQDAAGFRDGVFNLL